MRNVAFALMALFALAVISAGIIALEQAGGRVYPTNKPPSRFDPERPTGERYYSPLKNRGTGAAKQN